jgi:hypothetical protein
MPQPVTFTPDAAAWWISGMTDVRSGPELTMPSEFLFLGRVQLAWTSVAAGFGATLHARAIVDDLDGVAEPVTKLGKLHHAWVRERGLPGALDHHDHP